MSVYSIYDVKVIENRDVCRSYLKERKFQREQIKIFRNNFENFINNSKLQKVLPEVLDLYKKVEGFDNLSIIDRKIKLYQKNKTSVNRLKAVIPKLLNRLM